MFQPSHLRRLLVVLPVVLCAAAAGPSAGVSQQAGQSRDAGLVSVEFRVLGDNGAPVLDLKPGDVSLKVSGRAREIRDLELVRLPGPEPTADGKPAPDMVPAFASNSPSDGGRMVYVMLDDESIPSGREQTVRDAVMALDASLSGRDRLGLVIASHGKFDVELTTRHADLAAVLKTFTSRAMKAEAPEDAACRTLQAINLMKSVIGVLSSRTPAAVVFISGGLAPPNYAIAVPKRTTSAAASDTGKTACEVKKDLFDDLSNDARKAALDVWVAQVPTDVVAATINSNLLVGIDNMAGLTGNPLIRLTHDPRSDFARLTKESSAYYIATFEADTTERTGAPLRVELKVSRDNAQVRARTEMTIPKPAGGTQNATDLLRVATSYRDAPIRAAALAARGASADELNVMTLFEPGDPTLAFSSAAIGLYDDKGKLVRQWSSKPADLAATPTMAAVTAKPGVYRMRVAVVDVMGRSGTVDQEVKVDLEKGDGAIQFSTPMLGMPFNGSFAPKLAYRAEPSALGYVEIYGTSKTAAVTATVELATSSTGPATATAPARVGQPTADGRRIILGEIPIASVKPGEYVVRFNVTVDGKPAGTVMKTLRKSDQ